MLPKYFLSLCTLCALAIGCNTKLSQDSNCAFVGGEIINPKNDYVALYDTNGDLIDSLKLDSKNRFIHKIEAVEAGLHSITHGGEFQLVLLEPRDSIMFRLNTFDFDESLVFTGEGSIKNNYLIKTYLSNQIEAKKLVKYAKMEPEAFSSFIEERRLKQMGALKDFLKKNDESDLFKSIIKTNINYNAYADMEIYPFAYFGDNKLVHVKDLPEDFYAYRKNIDYDLEYLRHSFDYNRFLFSHIENLALNSYYATNDFHSKFNRHCMAYNKSKLDLIDSMIENVSIKNNLLKYKTRDFISHNHTQEEAKEMLTYYLERSTNEVDKANMTDLVENLSLLRQGNPIPDLKIVNYNNTEHNLGSVIKKPSIIYFWSSNYKKQYRNSHYVVRQLKKKFDNVDFISINVNDNDDKYWKDIIGNYKFPTDNEFKFKDSKTAKKILAVNYLNKAIIVDENGLILHPNVNIFNSDFETQLKGLINKKHLVR